MTAKEYIHKYRTQIIILILALIPFICLFFNIIIGKLFNGTDIVFHYQRLLELRYDIGHGILPQFFMHDATPKGSAINIFYPYETLIPIILVTWFIHRPMTLLLSTYYLIWYFISLSSYGSAKSYFKSRKVGLLFSVLYTAASTISNTLLLNDDIGQCLSFAWQPLVLFGFLWILRDSKHWAMLAFGMSLLLMSHLLTTILTIATLAVLVVCNAKKIFTNIHIIGGYVKAAIMTTIMAAIFWMPFLYTMMRNKFYNPGKSTNFWMSGLIDSKSGVFIHENANFIDLLGAVIGIIGLYMLVQYYHNAVRIPVTDWGIWATGIFYWLCNMNISLLRYFFGHSFIKVFQFSFRTALPIHICLAYIAVKWLAGYYSYNAHNKHHPKRVWIALCIAFALIMQVSNQFNDKLIYQSRQTYYSSNETNYGEQMGKIAKSGQGQGFNMNNNSFKYIPNSNILSDYQPKNTTTQDWSKNPYAFASRNFEAIKAGKPFITQHTITDKDGIWINPSYDMHDMMMPIVWYHGYHYHVTDNGKPVKWIKNRQANFIELPKLNAGSHFIQAKAEPSMALKNGVGISVIGWLVFACLYVRQRRCY